MVLVFGVGFVFLFGVCFFLGGAGRLATDIVSTGMLDARASQGGAGARIRAHKKVPQCTSKLSLGQQAQRNSYAVTYKATQRS